MISKLASHPPRVLNCARPRPLRNLNAMPQNFQNPEFLAMFFHHCPNLSYLNSELDETFTSNSR